MSRNGINLFPPRRRRCLRSATNVEAVESRLVLSTLDPTGTAGLLQPPETPMIQASTQPPGGYQLPGGGFYQPPQQTVTGTVSVDINYQYLSPDLVFNGVGDTSVPGVLRYDSGVPFHITGQTSGPARLVIIHPDGHLEPIDVNGAFSVPRVISTSGVLGTEMELKAQLFGMPNSIQAGQLISSAMKTETLNIQTFRFEDYFGKLGEKADSAITDQIHSQLDHIFPVLTDELIPQIAERRFGGVPTSAQEDQIRDEIEERKDFIAGRLDEAGRFALQQAIDGNKMTQKFVFGGHHPSGQLFSNGLAASKGAYGNEFEFGDVTDYVGMEIPRPSTEALVDALSSANSFDDVRSLFEGRFGLTIDGPELQILDGVSFDANSSFFSDDLLSKEASLAAYEVTAGLNFFEPDAGPPLLGGPRMQGRFEAGYRKMFENGELLEESSGDAIILRAKIRY